MTTKARELQADPRRAQPYRPPDMAGRVRHDTLWERAKARAREHGSASVRLVK